MMRLRPYCGGAVFGCAGSYFLGLPRLKCRLFTNSASSTIQKEPKSSSYRTKHLCSDRLVRIAFYNSSPFSTNQQHLYEQSYLQCNSMLLTYQYLRASIVSISNVFNLIYFKEKPDKITMKAQTDRRGN